MNFSIKTFVNHKESDKNFDWLSMSLQAALEIELFTIPPYLLALWSINDTKSEIYSSIRTIVIEEMIHMGLVCNIMKGINLSPDLTSNRSFPKYPQYLPGGIKNKTKIYLESLTKESVKGFMSIEKPEFNPSNYSESIGAFYDEIERVFIKLSPTINTRNQITGPLAPFVINDNQKLSEAINLIKHQGEGTSKSPEDSGPDDLAHYYRFKEIYEGKKYVKDPNTGKWGHNGSNLNFPTTTKIEKIPSTGYPENILSKEVKTRLNEFNKKFYNVLFQLETAWQNGSYKTFLKSIESMFELEDLATKIMSHKKPKSQSYFGPTFSKKIYDT